jgi:hypothetical protein
MGLGCSDTPTERQFDAVAACGRHGCGERQVRSVSSSPAGPMIARRDRLAPFGRRGVGETSGRQTWAVRRPGSRRSTGTSIRQKGEGDFGTMLETLIFVALQAAELFER